MIEQTQRYFKEIFLVSLIEGNMRTPTSPHSRTFTIKHLTFFYPISHEYRMILTYESSGRDKLPTYPLCTVLGEQGITTKSFLYCICPCFLSLVGRYGHSVVSVHRVWLCFLSHGWCHFIKSCHVL